jgi:hypothetical protein
MKTIVISALALGAMTSVALAEESLQPIAGQPMELSLAQLDDVTAGHKPDRKKKHKFNKVEIDIKQVAKIRANHCTKCVITVVQGVASDQDVNVDVEF